MNFFKNGEPSKPAEVFSSQVKPTLVPPKEKSKAGHDLSDFMSVKSDHQDEPSIRQDYFGGFGGSDVKAQPTEVPTEKRVKRDAHTLSAFKSVGSNKSAKSGISGKDILGKAESKKEEGINFSDFGDHMSSSNL